MTKTNPKISFPLKKWVLFNFLGWVLGIIIVLILSSTFDAIGIESLQFFVAVGIGFGVGLLQWLLLKRHFNISSKWIGRTILGMTIPFLIADVLKHFDILDLKSLFIPICVAIGSILVGLFQGRLLTRVNISQQKWIIASFFAWMLIAFSLFGIEYTNSISSNVILTFAINLALILSGGIILGMITGALLSKE